MYGISKDATPITSLELVDVIKDLDNKGMVPFSVTQITAFKTTKSAHPKFELEGYSGKGGITSFAKVSQVNGSINISYAAKVNRERLKEGLEADFVPVARNVYDTITKAVKSKGVAPDLVYYMFYFPNFNAASFDPAIYGMDENNAMYLVDRKDIESIIPVVKGGSGRQELTNEVVVRNLTFKSIAGLKINGNEYIISDLDDIRGTIFDMRFEEV